MAVYRTQTVVTPQEYSLADTSLPPGEETLRQLEAQVAQLGEALHQPPRAPEADANRSRGSDLERVRQMQLEALRQGHLAELRALEDRLRVVQQRTDAEIGRAEQEYAQHCAETQRTYDAARAAGHSADQLERLRAAQQLTLTAARARRDSLINVCRAELQRQQAAIDAESAECRRAFLAQEQSLQQAADAGPQRGWLPPATGAAEQQSAVEEIAAGAARAHAAHETALARLRRNSEARREQQERELSAVQPPGAAPPPYCSERAELLRQAQQQLSQLDADMAKAAAGSNERRLRLDTELSVARRQAACGELTQADLHQLRALLVEQERTQEAELRHLEMQQRVAQALQEDELRRIRSSAESDLAERRRVQQLQLAEERLQQRVRDGERDAREAAARFERNLRERDAELSDLRKELAYREAEHARQQGELRIREQALGERDQVLAPALREQLRAKELELTALSRSQHQQHQHAESVAQRLREELQEEREGARRLQERAEGCAQQLDDRRGEIAGLQEHLDIARKHTADATAQCDALGPELERWRQAAAATQRAEAELRERLEAHTEGGRQEMQNRDGEIETLRSENGDLRQAVQHLQAQLKRRGAESQQAERAAAEQLRALGALQLTLSASEAELKHTAEALAVVSRRNKDLEGLHMTRVVAALEREYFPPADGARRDPSPVQLSRQLPPPAEADLGSLSDPEYAPVVESIATFIRGSSGDRPAAVAQEALRQAAAAPPRVSASRSRSAGGGVLVDPRSI
eukprot:TRINITY_DN3150_c0_g1_i3.p1 TRINITY_DN3150_c0_g1~~TRINITY_DN3150_c0_g1_i3.p1  ORF type:complete len:786 (+),score=315.13 TRINITY_DN3150_c0_g1_i3:79-2358(+)